MDRFKKFKYWLKNIDYEDCIFIIIVITVFLSYTWFFYFIADIEFNFLWHILVIWAIIFSTFYTSVAIGSIVNYTLRLVSVLAEIFFELKDLIIENIKSGRINQNVKNNWRKYMIYIGLFVLLVLYMFISQ